MGEYITISNSVFITVFSMIIVFTVLIIISYLIKGLSNIAGGGKKPQPPKANPVIENRTEDRIENKVEEEIATNDINDEELVAVIAAAIASSLGVSIPEVNIKSIKRMPQTTPAWAETGRREQMFGKL
ncbi:OadG family protein [Tissierella sp. MSJ-40]|uniref:OadG family protein n=1 Tax=Tissierella simiarum TaxID=2841534 RepID=A0ABS6EE13_9FIRM|nr:OadG family protein [Tissierella simiarum]MBU5440393.1 OadG family protein [Tissierella simiarum]